MRLRFSLLLIAMIGKPSASAEEPATINVTTFDPNWTELRQSPAWVIWPKTREEKVKVILHKSAKSWYTFTDSAVEYLPAVISKDQRALKRPYETTSGQDRIEDSEVLGTGRQGIQGTKKLPLELTADDVQAPHTRPCVVRIAQK